LHFASDRLVRTLVRTFAKPDLGPGLAKPCDYFGNACEVPVMVLFLFREVGRLKPISESRCHLRVKGS
jgi:hypothetical protein